VEVVSFDYINKVIQGDIFEVIKQIKSNSVDLVIVDPPYGINYKEWDKIDNFVEFSESWINECFRVLKETGSFYSFMDWSNVAEFKLLLDKYGIIRNWITWERTKGRGSKNNFKSMKEEILYYTKSNKFTWNEQMMLKKHVLPYVSNGLPRGWFTDENGIRCRWVGLGNVWHYTVPFWSSKEYVAHPSQKPLLMYERIILSSSNEGDIIFEPFCGSAPACKTAKKFRRNFIGVELDKKWVDLFYIPSIDEKIDVTLFE